MQRPEPTSQTDLSDLPADVLRQMLKDQGVARVDGLDQQELAELLGQTMSQRLRRSGVARRATGDNPMPASNGELTDSDGRPRGDA